MTRLEIGLSGAVALMGLFIGWDYHQKSVASAATEARIEERQVAKAQLDSMQKESDQKFQAAQKEWGDKYVRLDKMTPKQIVEKAPQYVALPKPIIIAGPETQGVPIGSAIVPPEDVKPLGQAILDGKKCTETDLPKCQFDLKTAKDQFALRDQDAKDWEKQAKGGSFGSKLWGCAKIGGFGAGAGALPDTKDRGRYALYGFGLTFVPCMVIKH